MANSATAILNVGMLTAVGVNAPQTVASLRAGISRVAQSPLMASVSEPMTMGLVPAEALPPVVDQLAADTNLTPWHERMLRLAGPALAEATAGLADPQSVPLFLGLPEPFEHGPCVPDERFIQLLAAQSRVSFDVAASGIATLGQASGLNTLQHAVEVLQDGHAERVLVGGVDTFADFILLSLLRRQDRILGGEVADGFIPGEGAAFLLLGTPSPEEPALAWLHGLGLGFEEGHRYSDTPYRGEGLATAFQTLFETVPTSVGKIHTVLAGLNGERFGAKEWGVAMTRCHDRFAEEVQIEHPIEYYGDPGAALGPLMLGQAALGLRNGFLNGPGLVWCASDHGSRAAAIIDREGAH